MNRKFFLMLFVLCGCVLVGATPNTPDPDSEIHQFVDLFVKKWNQHNPKELSQLWAENGDLMNPAGDWEKGRNNVLKILVREHQSLLHASEMKQKITNILFLSPNIAWVDANVSIYLNGFPKGSLDHHIIYLLVKENNQWRILAVRPYQFLELHVGHMESPHAVK